MSYPLATRKHPHTSPHIVPYHRSQICKFVRATTDDPHAQAACVAHATSTLDSLQLVRQHPVNPVDAAMLDVSESPPPNSLFEYKKQ